MSKSYKIKVPATSANLGPGFDCIGIALNLYNEFIIKKSSEYKYKNILDKFCNEDNLFIKSAKCVYQYYQMDEIKFELEIIENVPISRGLGSSATCIIGGLIAGFLMLEKEIDHEVVLLLANKIEGHPDNVAPAYLGGLVCSFIEDEKVYSYQYQVSSQIKFNTLIPDFPMETRVARGALPKVLEYNDAIYSMSRAINIPKLLEIGNFEGLFYAFKDRLHQPYRFPLIDESEKFINYSNQFKLPFVISGSGSTLLMLSKNSVVDDLNKIELTHKWRFLELAVDNTGAIWEVCDD